MEIAIIGSGDAVIGFSLAGVKKAYEVTTEEELQKRVEEVMADPKVGILVLNQKDYNRLPKRTQATLSNSVRPTVVSIGTEQSTEMREKIKRAIGVDLWK